MQDGVWLSLARAPGLGPGGRSRTLAFQARYVGSIPITRSIFCLSELFQGDVNRTHGFGLRFAPVGAKQVPQAPGTPSPALFFCSSELFQGDVNRTLTESLL